MVIKEHIVQLRESRRLTGRQLAKLAGISNSSLARIEAGFANPSYETLQKIAAALQVDIKDIIGETDGEKPTLKQIAWKLLDLAESTGLSTVPLRGSISAGMPLIEEERIGEYVSVPEELIKGAKRAYALRVYGNSLSQHGIHEGDNVIIDPDAAFIPGKVYAIRIGNEVAAKCLTNEKPFEGLEILGRIIAYGSWNKL